MRRFVLGLLLSLAAEAHAQDGTEPMPALPDLDAASRELADRCGRSDAAACTALADLRFSAGDGTTGNALCRRAADLARAATSPRAVTSGTTSVRSMADAIAALERGWSATVVPGAAAQGMGDLARSALTHVFGGAAVTSWRGRRATLGDAFRTVHTMQTREGGIWASGVWVDELATLVAPGDVWELTLGYMFLDFVAYVADDGRILAVVHYPEG